MGNQGSIGSENGGGLAMRGSSPGGDCAPFPSLILDPERLYQGVEIGPLNSKVTLSGVPL